MSIEEEDLSLRDEDAENIVGGKRAKTAHKTEKPAGSAVTGGSIIASSTTQTPEVTGEDEVDIEC